MPITLALPALGKIIGYGLASLLGIFATYFIGKKLSGWLNEIKAPQNANESDQGHVVADQSNQDINNQLSHLPKE